MSGISFPKLYALDKNGKVKEWTIFVENKGDYSVINYSYGYTDGKKTEYKLEVKEGKNKGKKNETTHYKQALSDAKSRWDKKKTIDKYNETIFQEKDENNNNVVVESIPSPMLAQDYNKHKKKVSFPCYIQPKLDGYRMIYYKNKMWSRNGKEYTILQDTPLHKELQYFEDIVLDGELYVHNKLNFEQYGVLRKQKITSEDLEILKNMEYHVYDIINSDSYDKRNKILAALIQEQTFKNIKLVDTYSCNDENDINKYADEFIKNGYEGSMIRNKKGEYKLKYRSYDLLKNKTSDDDEFEIVDFTYENDVLGKNDKVIVWICKTKDGKIFHVPSKGTREERNSLYQRGNNFVGKMLSVQYFGLTNDNVPRFPKSLREGEASVRKLNEE